MKKILGLLVVIILGIILGVTLDGFRKADATLTMNVGLFGEG